MSNQDSTQNVPALRLDGFEGEWLQTTIGQICQRTYGGGTPSSTNDAFWLGDIPWIQSSDVAETGVESATPKKFVTSQAITNSAAAVIPANSIAVVSRVGVGKVALMTSHYATSQDFVSLSHLNGDPTFLAVSIKEELLGLMHQLQGSTIKGITKPELLSHSLDIPPARQEQQAIGAVFTNLDAAIDQHTDKHRALQRTKTALMQKMLPRDGQAEPDLRLDGFEGEWDSSEFGDIVRRSTLFSDTPGLPRVEYEDIHSGLGILNKDLRAKQSTKVGIHFQPGDVLYGKLRPYLKNWLLSDFEGIAVGDFWVLRPRAADPHFIYTLIQTNRFSEAASISSGSKMPRADWALVSQTQLPVPPTLEEQQAIGAVFSKLDTLISAEAQRIEKLKQTKTALLQKMFV